jgi:hypothetical protein
MKILKSFVINLDSRQSMLCDEEVMFCIHSVMDNDPFNSPYKYIMQRFWSSPAPFKEA